MTPTDREFVADICGARAGLVVDAQKDYLIESRLAPVARREGFGSVAELVAAVRADQEERQVWALVEAMASGETAFFRDRAVLQRLVGEVAPELARRRRDGLVRIWSAGCGSGQEIYSLAMLLEDAAPNGGVELFASDLSERLLDQARSGVYSQFEVQRGLRARELVRCFENRGDGFALARRLRQQVRWRRVNLLEDLAPLGQFDIVLCRNVLSTLSEAAQARVLRSLAAALPDDGVLVLGAEERPDQTDGFAPFPTLPGVLRRVTGRRAAA